MGASTNFEGRMFAINGAPSLDASFMTTPAGTSTITLGSVIADFSIFAGIGAVSNTGASTTSLSVGTNAGTVTGFGSATIGGSSYIRIINKADETLVINFHKGFQQNENEEYKVAFVLKPYEVRTGSCDYNPIDLKIFKQENPKKSSKSPEIFSLSNITLVEYRLYQIGNLN